MWRKVFVVIFSVWAGFTAWPAHAEEETHRVRMMTYNIRYGWGAAGVKDSLDLARIARVINEKSPDLVALQEVDVGMKRTDGVDQAIALGEMTGLTAVFGVAHDYSNDGVMGNAVLTRFPVTGYLNHHYPLEPVVNPEHIRFYGRSFLEVRVRVGTQILTIYSTHWPHLGVQQYDRFNAGSILRCAEDRLHLPLIAAGDLNTRPYWDEFPPLLDFLFDPFEANAGGDFTAPAESPFQRIDFVLHNGDSRLSYRPGSYLILNDARTRWASDHLPVVTEYDLEMAPRNGDERPCSESILVDKRRTPPGDGTYQTPWVTVAAAVEAASPGTLVGIHAETYYEPQTIGKDLCLCTYGGLTKID